MHSRLAAYLIAATVLLVDRVSKGIIEAKVSPWDTYVVIPGFFNIVHTRNRGIAFGLFGDTESELRTWFLVALSVLVLGLVATVLWQPGVGGMAGGRLSRVGLSLVLGGALGNLFDRLAHGTVTDFLQFYIGAHEWPSFNVADSAITVGAGLLLLELWQARRKVVET